jgi:four helix bundle protein
MKNSKLQRSNSKEGSRRNGQGLQRRLRYDEAEPAPMKFILNEDAEREPENRRFDLEERTAVFGESIIKFCKKIPRVPGNGRLVDQVVGAATSVGANYIEATESVSKKDFKLSISRSKKEAKETRFFLRMVVAAEPSLASEARRLYREANELMLIFAAIYRK